MKRPDIRCLWPRSRSGGLRGGRRRYTDSKASMHTCPGVPVYLSSFALLCNSFFFFLLCFFFYTFIIVRFLLLASLCYWPRSKNGVMALWSTILRKFWWSRMIRVKGKLLSKYALASSETCWTVMEKVSYIACCHFSIKVTVLKRADVKWFFFPPEASKTGYLGATLGKQWQRGRALVPLPEML